MALINSAVEAYNDIVGELNESSHKIRIYAEDWATLPTSVKSGLKTYTNGVIDTAITDLTNLKTDISGS